MTVMTPPAPAQAPPTVLPPTTPTTPTLLRTPATAPGSSGRHGETFVHLHVASGYSMRYGTAKPHQLVERAAAFGQPALALTDRDGLYGAVKFVRSCMEHDVAPILGVDLALGPEQPEHPRRTQARPARTPVRGGALVDPRLPRVTVL
ncbi:MAG: polymerase alpha subunit, partial [Humibacillus sp.]|nr:polymerase alpha subunit [Humibacillus sp.]